MSHDVEVITGAFGYVGRYIALRLLREGKRVRTLTGRQVPRIEDTVLGEHCSVVNERSVEVLPYDFDRPDRLAAHLSGARCLYNTYWVRFPRRHVTFARAIANSRTLIQAAVQAGVRRIVHISITNPSERSSLAYFAGKAEVERFIRDSGLSYAIIRPTVLFGGDDILINNSAWLLRRLPVFAIPGDGRYRLQPVHVEDVADLAVHAGAAGENLVLDAAGPERYTFDGLVRLIAHRVGSRARIVHAPKHVSLAAAKLIGLGKRDVLLTRDELEGLMAELLLSHQPPTGRIRFNEWLAECAESLGGSYRSELDRHYR